MEFLQKSELIIAGHRVLFCTLWSDFEIYGDRADNMRIAHAGMHDYRHITVEKTGFKRLTPSQIVQIHVAHRGWLEDKLSDGFEGKTTVITHHAPHRKALEAETELGHVMHLTWKKSFCGISLRDGFTGTLTPPNQSWWVRLKFETFQSATLARVIQSMSLIDIFLIWIVDV